MTSSKSGLIKKHKARPVRQDFSALDAAVEELTRHNAMLQKEVNGETQTKRPQLPKKKQVQPHKSGRSFDIVHHGARMKRPTHNQIAPTRTVVLPKQPSRSLELPPSEPLVETELAAEAVQPKALEHTQPLLLEPAHNAPKPRTSENPNTSTPETQRSDKVQADAPENQASPDDTDEAAVDRQIGELYANNLVQSSNPAGYTPHKGQPELAVFDAEDYHGELHDWSRLSHRTSKLRVVFLVILVAILVVLVVALITPDILPNWFHIPGF